MSAYALALLAGGLTTLNPCVLPLLPVIVGSALAENRFGPLAISGGLVISFAAFGVFFASIGFNLGIDAEIVRIVAAGMILLAGAVLLSERLGALFVRVVAPAATGAQSLLQASKFSGLGGQFLIGVLMGVVWTPCIGPTLVAASGLAAQTETLAQAAMMMLLFGAGVAVPMLALAYGSRVAVARRKARFRAIAARAKPALGIILLAVGIAALSGFDRTLEAWLVNAMPDWLIAFTTRI